MGYRVFISFKNLDRQENPTPDSAMAEELYRALTKKGVNTFYSNVSLKDLAASDFLDAIYAALEQCSIFIAVGSDISYFESRWLKFEARTFQMEYLNGNKPETEYGMITFVTPNLRRAQSKFIQPLRDMQSFCKLEDVVDYVTNRLRNAAMLKRMHDEDDVKDDIKYHSVSLADMVFERRHGVSPVEWDAIEEPVSLEVRYRNEVESDATYIFDDDASQQPKKEPTFDENEDLLSFLLSDPLILDRYSLLAEIGRGGSSLVILAQDQRDGAIRAVKALSMKQDNSLRKAAFSAEANALNSLKHPMIPMFVEAVDRPDYSLIVMEYIAGESLQRIVDRDGAQSERCVIDWMLQLCDFLYYLHSIGLVYRDMKPSNIILQRRGVLSVLDYASVQLIDSEQVDTFHMGTVGYAAPEQYGSQGKSDERTDIYCLGATIYHLITGERLSSDKKEIKSLNPDVSPEFEAIIEKCLQIDPWERYQSVNSLVEELSNLDSGAGGRKYTAIPVSSNLPAPPNTIVLDL